MCISFLGLLNILFQIRISVFEPILARVVQTLGNIVAFVYCVSLTNRWVDKALNKCLESYLRCMFGKMASEWVVWLPLVEWWYNTTYHFAIHMSPYEALYGQEPPIHLPYLVGVSRVTEVHRGLQHREVMRNMLRFYNPLKSN